MVAIFQILRQACYGVLGGVAVQLPGNMDHLGDPKQLRQQHIHRLVDRTGAFAAAKYQQDRRLLVQVKMCPGRLWRPGCQVFSNRVTGDGDPGRAIEIFARAFGSHGHASGKACQESERQAGLNIWHVQHAWNSASGYCHWGCHIPSRKEQYFGFESPQDASRSQHSLRQLDEVARR